MTEHKNEACPCLWRHVGNLEAIRATARRVIESIEDDACRDWEALRRLSAALVAAEEGGEVMAKGFTHESTKNQTVEWYTPGWVFERLGLTFDLDPCHPEGDRLPWLPADRAFTKADDGLSQPWEGRVWLNPPYGAETPRWLERMSEHRHGIALVMARTDTQWFHRHGATADAVCFLEGRVKFVNRDGEPPIDPKTGKRMDSPGSGSMLLAWGADCVEALERSGLGVVYRRPDERRA